MPPATLFFTGAPLPCEVLADLVRDVADGGSDKLLTSFSASIAYFAGLNPDTAPVDPTGAVSSSLTAAAWHSLPLEGEHLRTGFSQGLVWEEYRGNAAYYAAEDPSFLSTQGGMSFRSEGDGSREIALEDVTSQFYEHSLALHDDLATSQIAAAPSASQSEEESGLSTSFTTTQFASTLDQNSVLSASQKKPVPNAGQITNLDSLPTSAYLQSITPQTMTLTLLCGILSISPPRSITTRHSNTVTLIELLVGDDQKSGFGINFWLPPSSPHTKSKSKLSEALQDLRPQDVILVRNMALSCFRGKVYGQSLRREMTKVDLLYRNRIDRADRAGCYSLKDLAGEGSEMDPLIAKTKRVREWVLRFVGGPAVVRHGDGHGEAKRGTKRSAGVAGLGVGEMPPDTQE